MNWMLESEVNFEIELGFIEIGLVLIGWEIAELIVVIEIGVGGVVSDCRSFP